MGLERFILYNLVLVPILLGIGYRFSESLPVIILPLGLGYITLVVLLTFAWGMSRLSLAMES